MTVDETNENSTLPQLAVLVNTCDKFEDCWGPFFVLWKKYGGKAINHTIYLNTERKTFDSPTDVAVRSLRVCETNGWTAPRPPTWSWCLEKALDAITEDFVLYLQEDYFLDRPADEDRIARILRWMSDNPGAGCVRLDCAAKSSPAPDGSFRPIDPKWWYFVSCQAAIWRKDVLHGLLREHEDAWQFERWGSKRARLAGCRFFALEPENGRWPLHYVKTGVIQGKWFDPVVSLFRENGIEVDFSRRGFYAGKYGKKESGWFRWQWNRARYNAMAFAARFIWPPRSLFEVLSPRRRKLVRVSLFHENV